MGKLWCGQSGQLWNISSLQILIKRLQNIGLRRSSEVAEEAARKKTCAVIKMAPPTGQTKHKVVLIVPYTRFV